MLQVSGRSPVRQTRRRPCRRVNIRRGGVQECQPTPGERQVLLARIGVPLVPDVLEEEPAGLFLFAAPVVVGRGDGQVREYLSMDGALDGASLLATALDDHRRALEADAEEPVEGRSLSLSQNMDALRLDLRRPQRAPGLDRRMLRQVIVEDFDGCPTRHRFLYGQAGPG